MKIAVLGAGSWGTALAAHLCDKQNDVTLWCRREEQAQEINTKHRNSDLLPELHLPVQMQCTTQLDCVCDAEMVVLSVPSQAVDSICRRIAPLLKPETVVVNTAKGFFLEDLSRLSQVIRRYLPQNPLVVLSGPSHAEEVAKKLPTLVVAASEDLAAAEFVQDVFMNQNLRVYTNSDLIGVEVAGAVKNVIAVCAGVLEGMGMGDNARAALITRGLAEITRLGVAMGGETSTFYGLAGLGDLSVTCGSRHSRNFRAGVEIGRGRDWHRVLQETHMVVEGITATNATYLLAKQYNVDIPIISCLYQVLYEECPVEKVQELLMLRSKKAE